MSAFAGTSRVVAWSLLLFAICVSAGLALIHHDRFTVQSSSVARWWRCVGIDKPELANSGGPWIFKYSWKGSEGPGSFEFTLRHDGQAILQAMPNYSDGSPQRKMFSLSPADVKSVATVIDESGLLCLETTQRQNYVVHDLGEYSIQLSSNRFSRVLTIDSCHAVEDPLAVDEVLKAVRALAPTIGPEIEWGPYGASSTPGHCGN